MTETTRIKICGLSQTVDADCANDARPDFAGLVFYPKSTRFVDDERARLLRETISGEIPLAGVFVDEPLEHIVTLRREGIIQIVQLHGHEDEGFIADLREALPGTEVWKAFKVRSQADLDAARTSSANRVLLDNGYGTGRSFDWSLLGGFERRFILAGGLTPENLPGAIERFHPWAVDLSSGVETDGAKDLMKMRAAVAAARG